MFNAYLLSLLHQQLSQPGEKIQKKGENICNWGGVCKINEKNGWFCSAQL